MTRFYLRIATFILCALLALPGLAAAQTSSGSISGVVKDESGAVLPGVTVEVASSALIEKTRAAVTDSSGNYKITDLRPGTYSVTFSLEGFNTLKREGLELSAGFTAPANAELKVGSLAETLTVTGASPVVDVQNVRSQQVLKQSVLEALPSGQRDLTQLASLTLGASTMGAGRNDVGGDKAETNTAITINGSRGDDSRINYDGLNTNVFYGNGGGQQRIWKFNTIGVQETVVDTGGAGADSETGGANVNMVPRDGANTFSVHSVLNFTNQDFASGKVPTDLINRGSAPNQNALKKVYDYGLGIGGPIKRDRLWFYSANRVWGGQSFAANNYFNKSTNPFVYEADLDRRAYTDQNQKDFGGRITWQAAAKHKITASVNFQKACGCWLAISAGARTAPEATISYNYGKGGPLDGMLLSQFTYTYPATSRLLIQAGGSFLQQNVSFTNDVLPGTNNISILESTTGYRWGALAPGITSGYENPQGNNNFGQRFSVSYVTGSHNIRVGMNTLQGTYDTVGDALPGGVSYTFTGGRPVSLTQFASPFGNKGRLRGFNLYAQDQYTVKRLTLNYGVRFDQFRGYTLDFTLPAGPFIGERFYEGVDDLPNFKDITPRIGAAYDVFGNGKTAIKGSWGRYLMGQGGGNLNLIAPANAVVVSGTRLWNDANGNFTPDCDLKNFAANGECQLLNEPQFGQPRPSLTWDESARVGWNIREFSYSTTIGVQHELRPGVGLTVDYYRTDWRNQTATVATNLTAANYTQFCINAPADGRLGDFSGQPVCGLWDLKAPTSVDRHLMLAKDAPGADGRPKQVGTGVNIGMNARFAQGGIIIGGVTLGRTTWDYCWQNNIPQALQTGLSATTFQPRTDDYCKVQSPLWDASGSQVKMQMVYPLPWQISLAGTYKNLPGIPIQSNLSGPNYNTLATQALGRGLTSATGVGLALLPYASDQGNLGAVLFDQRLSQVDLRATRTFKIQKSRIQGIVELYNVTNTRPSQANNTTYSAVQPAPGVNTWLTPTSILGGRLIKFGAQIDF